MYNRPCFPRHRILQLFKAVNHPILDRIKMGRIILKMGKGLPDRLCKPCCSRYIVRAGTHATLLPATKNERLHLCLFTDIQKAAALRSVQLMSADGKQVNVLLLRVDRKLAIGLNRINMEKNVRIVLFDHLPGLCDRLDRSNLIVHHHD